jgi:AAA domain-containing protein
MQSSAAVDWLIDGIVATNERIMVYADSGVGKSNVGVDVGASVAFGKPWHGREVKQGAVFYIASENPGDVGPMLKAWEKEHGGVAAWRETHSGPLPFHIIESGIDLLSPRSVDAVIAVIRSIAGTAALVVIDTFLASTYSGNLREEDTKRAQAEMTRITRETGATVLVLHHTRDDGGGAYGGSLVRGGFRVRYRLTRTDKGNKVKPEGPMFENGDKIVFTCEKMSRGRKPEPFRVKVRIVRVDGETMPVIADTRAVKAESPKEPRRKRKPRKERRLTQPQIWAECGGDVAAFAERTGLSGVNLRQAVSRCRRECDTKVAA